MPPLFAAYGGIGDVRVQGEAPEKT